jgi:FMN phosphatase YigB (HAD superfamily)
MLAQPLLKLPLRILSLRSRVKYNQSMKPILLFDIDKTLFDTDSFSASYRQKFIKYLAVSPEKFEKVRVKYHHSLSKHTDYNPDEFIKHIINSLHQDKQQNTYKKLRNLFYTSENFSKNLYPDTISALTDLKNRHLLGIFSEGNIPYQKTKLVKSSLYDFFAPRHIHIFHRKTDPASLLSLPENSTIVDDDPSVIDELLNQKIKTLGLIWLNRKTKSKHPHAKTIHSLTELI